MEKLNIAEILKDCPKGTKLYSLVHGEVKLTRVGVEDIYCKPNYLNHELSFSSDGRWAENQGECILFPSKENRDWSTFQRPFKDGDVLVGKCNQPFIFKKLNNNNGCFSYCGIDSGHRFLLASDDWTFANSLRFATEEEKQKLFDAIKANGYKWNAETKTLEKLIEPKFKVGDKISNGRVYSKIRSIDANSYQLENDDIVFFKEQNNFELVPNKFDITTLKPFDKVLVRDNNEQKWTVDMFSFYDKTLIYPFSCIGHYVNQCIPYEGNQHLLGTTNDCDEYFKNWE